MQLWIAISLMLVIAAGSLVAWRAMDHRADTRTWSMLCSLPERPGRVFNPSDIESLPEPAQRYLRYAIADGAVLYPVVEIDMGGELGMGTKSAPNYQPMAAQQLLAPPYGLVWKVRTGALSGSDGATPGNSWTRFWLYRILPVVRAGGNDDHRRSAFGRVAAEAAIWAPASLLTSDCVRWEESGRDTARAVVSFNGLEQAVDITVSPDGQPTRVIIQRWSNENPDKVFREQPFGGDLSGFREFDGFRLPTVVDGGNHIGTDDYFPFFRARVHSIRFPGRSATE